MDLILSKVPPRTLDDEVAAIGWACQTMLQSGITFSTDSWAEPGMAQIYKEAHDRGVLTVDLNISHLVSPEDWRDESDRIVRDRALLDEIDSINASSVKFLADGALFKWNSCTSSTLRRPTWILRYNNLE
jgi:hypothetical protein